jgi:hypothetical protein
MVCGMVYTKQQEFFKIALSSKILHCGNTCEVETSFWISAVLLTFDAVANNSAEKKAR